MKRANSWTLFFMAIGFLIIMTAPQTPTPGLMIFGGILIVVMSGAAILRSKKRKDDHKED
ncbi:MAG TPA: multidrug transporter [Candidatus Mediterraneibacter merdavium]|nr:multidrug transporter [Candidatus Mediterraneibacter merdavium]